MATRRWKGASPFKIKTFLKEHFRWMGCGGSYRFVPLEAAPPWCKQWMWKWMPLWYQRPVPEGPEGISIVLWHPSGKEMEPFPLQRETLWRAHSIIRAHRLCMFNTSTKKSLEAPGLSWWVTVSQPRQKSAVWSYTQRLFCVWSSIAE